MQVIGLVVAILGVLLVQWRSESSPWPHISAAAENADNSLDLDSTGKAFATVVGVDLAPHHSLLMQHKATMGTPERRWSGAAPSGAESSGE